MTQHHPAFPFIPPPLPPAILEHVRFMAASVKSSPCLFTAIEAARRSIARRCASDAELAAAMDELEREVQR